MILKGHNYIIALLGKSASGKSSVEQVVSNKLGLKRVVSTTTRKMRSNETNHIDYHFISEKDFLDLINNDELIEYRYYNTIENGKDAVWHYGIERDEVDLNKSSYICVVDLVGLNDLKKEFGYKVISIYIDVSEKTRKTRAMARDRLFEEDEWARRSQDDNIKFKVVEDVADTIIRNDNFDDCLDSVMTYIKNESDKRTFFTQYCSY